MAFGVGVQGLMTSSKCKQSMHKHTPIMSPTTKNPTSKTETNFFLPTATLSPFLEGWKQLSRSICC